MGRGKRGLGVRARSFGLVLAVAAMVLASGSAHAVTVQICDDGTCSASLAPLGTSTANADGSNTWTLTNPFVQTGLYTVNSWTATLKNDPFITNNVVVTNTSSSTQTFIATVTLPIPAFSYSQIGGSSVGVTVTDSVDGSVTVSSVTPNGIYSGTVNGVTALTLLPDPSTVSCSTFPGCSNTASANFPGGPAGPGVAT